MQLKGGQELQNGKYRIIRVLGQGGFGITYMAENILLGRFVAIKEFFPKDYCGRDNTSHLTLGTENNKETVEKLKGRFLKEAQNIAKLDHPGIVKIYDVFEEHNTAYYVMDLIIGENLSDVVKKQGPISKDRALDIIRKVGDALDYVHSRNMTHLDVKPANIVIRDKDNQPILIDFGLSKQFNLQGEATSTMLHGISHGYSPMELYTYGSITSFTPQTDIYSLAATLFYITSGQVPPSASEIIENGLTFPESFDPELKSIINKGMQPSRSKRPSTVNGLLERTKEETKNLKEIEETQIFENNNSDQKENTAHIEDNGNPNFTQTPSNKTEETVYSSSQEYYEEESESKSQKFLSWITGTKNLRIIEEIPTTRKIFYIISLLICSILGLGWVLWFFIYFYVRLKDSLKKLFFNRYLSEWEYVREYSIGEAVGIIFITILPGLAGLTLMIISISSNHKTELKEYVSSLTVQCPIPVIDLQISSVSAMDNEVIFNCVSFDSIHIDNRDKLNLLNIETIKPLLFNEENDKSKIFEKNSATFNFYNNGVFVNTFTITPKEIGNYKKLNPKEKAEEFLSAYTVLENLYLPWKIADNVSLTVIREEEFPDGKNYLTYYFYDPTGLIKKEFGDSIDYKIPQIVPTQYPYQGEIIADGVDGIAYKILMDNNKTIQSVIMTSSEMKLMIEDFKQHNN